MKIGLLMLLLCIAANAQTKSATAEQHKAVKEAASAGAALAAYDSLRALNDNVTTADVGYQPRLIEAEKNMMAAEHKVKTDEDKRQFQILKMWKEMIDEDRNLSISFQGSNDVETLRREIGFFKARLSCSLEADLTFNPNSLTERQRNMAEKHLCATDARVALENTGSE